MPRLYLLQWLKSDRALMMLFNDGTFQVNTPTAVAGYVERNCLSASHDVFSPLNYTSNIDKKVKYFNVFVFIFPSKG